MTQPILTTPGASAPTIPHEPRPHRCGRCANPTGLYIPGRCPNDPVNNITEAERIAALRRRLGTDIA